MPHRWGNTSRHDRGYGTAWTKLRLRIIARDNGLCQACLAEGRMTAFHAVDHIKPKAQGGTDADDNLRCLCRDHHEAKSLTEAAEAQGRTVKPKQAFDKDGRPVWPE